MESELNFKVLRSSTISIMNNELHKYGPQDKIEVNKYFGHNKWVSK